MPTQASSRRYQRIYQPELIVATRVAGSFSPPKRGRIYIRYKAAGVLNHPNICTLHDIGHQNGIEYIVMEYIDGESLAARLRKGPLPISELLRYSTQIADALDKAHIKGIIHRNLKPGNIIVSKSGIKVLDFGLAKIADQNPLSEVSQLDTAGISANAAVSNAPFVANANGMIIYRGDDAWAKTQLAWFDRQGKQIATVGSVVAAQYDVSNDGSRFLINTIVVPPIPANLYVIVNWKPPVEK